MIQVGLIGYGYWGPNLARVFSQHASCELARIADESDTRLRAAKVAHPTVALGDDRSVIESGVL